MDYSRRELNTDWAIEMNAHTTTEQLLRQVIELLRKNDRNDWASVLLKLLHMLEYDPISAKQKIRSLFGGMGSFSDLILYDQNNPLIEQNNELFDLRARLFDSCSQ